MINVPPDERVIRDNRLTIVRVICTLYDRHVNGPGGLKDKIKISMEAKKARFAESNGATFVEVNVKKGAAPAINNGNYQAWFAGPNHGNPFDQRLAAKVESEIAADGITID